MIELHDLRYAWPRAGRDCLAIDALQVSAGETLFLHGPSGCGKSTLLSLMAGLIPLSTGEILIDGQAIRKPHPKVGVVLSLIHI